MTERARNQSSTDIVSDQRMQLDAFARGEIPADTLGQSLAALCSASPDAAWETLALLDQYHRRQQLPLDLFLTLKTRVNGIALGSAGREGSAGSIAADADRVTRELPARADADRVARELLARADPTRSIEPVTEQPVVAGRLLKERYLIEGLLGRGGMSAVYRAIDRQRNPLPERGRYVAVKVLNHKLSQRPEAVAAFQNEFRHLQHLSHPGIVNVFDLDQDGSAHFYTMELLDGELLGRVMERMRPQNLERSQALAILRDIGLALVYAHEHGVVHGDLKPDNIMLTRPGEVRVLDFGAAGRLALREPWIAEGIEHGFRTATPTYTSCERLAGAAPGARDDIFSLSCVAYELLSGTHPFRRLLATEARSKKMRPVRIAGLTGRQWKTLSSALTLDPDLPAMSTRDWLAGLELERAPLRAPPLSRLETQRLKSGSATHAVLLIVLVVIAVAAFVWRQDLARVTGPPIQALQSRLGNPGASLQRRPSAEAVPSAATEAATPTTQNVPSASVAAEPADAVAATDIDRSADAPAKPVLRPGAGRISFAQDVYVVRPSDGAARILLTRSGGNTGNVGFAWWTEDGTARDGKDFISLGRRSERLQSGETTIAIFVPLISDPLRRHSEIFYVALGDPRGGVTTGDLTRATVVIDRAEDAGGAASNTR